MLWTAVFYGFVFDDIYISCRYAENLRTGNGMVFNLGERVEGYTNFLWTLFCVPFTAAGGDPAVYLKILSIASALVLVFVFYSSLREYWGSTDKAFIMALFLSASPYFAVWAHPGMETTFFSLVGFLSGYLIFRKKYFWGFLVSSTSPLIRPEGYIFFLSAVLAFLTVQRPFKITKLLKYLFFPVLILILYNTWRFLYFGDLLPNTYYVKMSGGLLRIIPGAEMIVVGLLLGGTGYFLFLAFTNRNRDFFTLYSVIVSWLFFAYSVSGTPDFFTTYRLFTPSLPFILFASAHKISLKNKISKIFLYSLLALNVITVLLIGFFFREMKPSLERAHGSIALILNKEASKGDVVVSQEMGLIPYRNPDLYFYDVIGLVTKDVSMKLFQEGVSPFTMYLLSKTPEGLDRVQKLRSEMRDMIFEIEPDWVITVAYPSWSEGGKIWEEPNSKLSKDLLVSYSSQNVFFYNLLFDDRFWERYELVKVFPSYRIYYVLLFQRKPETVD